MAGTPRWNAFGEAVKEALKAYDEAEIKARETYKEAVKKAWEELGVKDVGV